MAVFLGIIIPFVGTVLGSAMVFLLKDKINNKIQKLLLGFAAGVMIAASIWSLIIPAIELSDNLGKWSFIPAAVGFILGMVALLGMDSLIPHLHLNSDKPEGVKSNYKKRTMFFFAVMLHNIPEGIAVGVVLAAAIHGNELLTISGALALAVGIAIQNFPEGAIISLPMKNDGNTRTKSFIYGTISGVVEPLAAAITLLIAGFMEPILPYLLAFAAGAMIYVVVEELIPEANEGEHSNFATIGVMIGFVIMMILDIALA